MKRTEQRVKQVHGVAYAAFIALATLLQSHKKLDLENYRTWMVRHTVKAMEDVRSQVNVNVIWEEIINAYKAEVFGRTAQELRRFFNVTREQREYPPGAPNQGYWWSYKLFFDYGALAGLLERYLVQQRRSLPLGRNDVREQMATKSYWLDGKQQQRFVGKKSSAKCWGVDVDLHPMGYQIVSDELLAESKQGIANPAAAEASGEWCDPRKGPLYELVHAVERKEAEGALPM